MCHQQDAYCMQVVIVCVVAYALYGFAIAFSVALLLPNCVLLQLPVMQPFAFAAA